MKEILIKEGQARGIGGIDIIGPAPAFIHRLRGRFRWQMVLRGQNLSAFIAPLSFAQGWTVDIDPVSLI